jgi:DNA end-binding protein Ku
MDPITQGSRSSESRRGWTEKEMDLAHRLIEALADKWKPEEFHDTYTEVLRKAIEAKVEGKEVELPRAERPRPVANLMKALEESLARKEPAKVVGRSAKGPQKRWAGKRAA